MKPKTDRIITIAFWLSVSFLIAASMTRWLLDIDAAPKAPPYPPQEAQTLTPLDGPQRRP